MKRGFTLLEMTLATAVFTTVFATLGAVTVGVRRLIGNAYSTAELSMRMRGLREKLLFHAAPTREGKIYSGLLSGMPTGTTALESSTKISVSAYGVKLSDGSSLGQSIKLVPVTASGNRKMFSNESEATAFKQSWLCLNGMGWGKTATGKLGYLDGNSAGIESRLIEKNLFFINLKASLGDVVRSERIVIPVFGTEQQKNSNNSVFHDNLLQ